MTLRLVLRTLLGHPLRAAVLSCGFGFGIAVMAALLGVGQVVLEQAQAPALKGGGDMVIHGPGGAVANARFLLAHVLATGNLARRVRVASPAARETLYLIEPGRATQVRARGGIPSREQALDDPETAAVAAWHDTDADRAWTAPAPGELLRSLDRFHPIPAAPGQPPESWAEWLYFNGRSADGQVRFYLSFLVGAPVRPGVRPAGVRLQLEANGRRSSWSSHGEVSEAALLESAPDLDFTGGRVRLDGQRYAIALDLAAEAAGGERLTGDIALEGRAGASLPPFTLRGAGGWVSGYVVPVLEGQLSGTLRAGRTTLSLAGGAGYHDHNWGYWSGVTWQWGQVAAGGRSIVYGRVRPPPEAVDPERVPAFLALIGPDGILGSSTDVTIDEQDLPDGSRPKTIRVRARGALLDIGLQFDVAEAIRSRRGGGAVDFLQMRGTYAVRGSCQGTRLDFTAPGAAETFRGE